MKKYVIDTNFFFNLEIKSGLGDNPKQIIIAITEIARVARDKGLAEFYMPPRIVEEMMTFVESEQEYINNLLAFITIQSPEITAIDLPAEVFYKFIEDVRHRAYRGLQIAEEEVTNIANSAENFIGLDKIESQKKIGENIKKLRERYRQATRYKFLDSLADLDIIMLSKQLNATLVTSDEGVRLWGREFGVMEILPQNLKQQLDLLLA